MSPIRLGVLGNPRYGVTRDVLGRLAAVASQHGVSLYSEPDLLPAWPESLVPPPWSDGQPLDALVTFGGDGTLLRGARRIKSQDIPILGINLGRVGFLTSADAPQLEQAIGDFASGHYRLEHRSTLITGDGQVALNDIVVHAAGVARVLQIRVYLDEEEIGQYSADGVIVATPTGSTAYSLSAGGPIVLPGVEALVITAICPHTLAVRPLVVHAAAEIRLEPISPYPEEVLISYDGQVSATVPPGGVVSVRRGTWKVALVRLGDAGFFRNVRQKLHWGDLTDREHKPLSR